MKPHTNILKCMQTIALQLFPDLAEVLERHYLERKSCYKGEVESDWEVLEWEKFSDAVNVEEELSESEYAEGEEDFRGDNVCSLEPGEEGTEIFENEDEFIGDAPKAEKYEEDAIQYNKDYEEPAHCKGYYAEEPIEEQEDESIEEYDAWFEEDLGIEGADIHEVEAEECFQLKAIGTEMLPRIVLAEFVSPAKSTKTEIELQLAGIDEESGENYYLERFEEGTAAEHETECPAYEVGQSSMEGFNDDDVEYLEVPVVKWKTDQNKTTACLEESQFDEEEYEESNFEEEADYGMEHSYMDGAVDENSSESADFEDGRWEEEESGYVERTYGIKVKYEDESSTEDERFDGSMQDYEECIEGEGDVGSIDSEDRTVETDREWEVYVDQDIMGESKYVLGPIVEEEDDQVDNNYENWHYAKDRPYDEKQEEVQRNVHNDVEYFGGELVKDVSYKDFQGGLPPKIEEYVKEAVYDEDEPFEEAVTEGLYGKMKEPNEVLSPEFNECVLEGRKCFQRDTERGRNTIKGHRGSDESTNDRGIMNCFEFVERLRKNVPAIAVFRCEVSERIEEARFKELVEIKEISIEKSVGMVKQSEIDYNLIQQSQEGKDVHINSPMEEQEGHSKTASIGRMEECGTKMEKGSDSIENDKKMHADKSEQTTELEADGHQCFKEVEARGNEKARAYTSVGEQAGEPGVKSLIPSRSCLLMMARIIYPELAAQFDSRLGRIEA